HFPTQAFFGDTHLHTSWSTDAGLAGASLGPDEAYRVARGEVVTSHTGLRVKLNRPLDFIVVADHAENLGLSDFIERSDPILLANPTGKRWHDMVKAGTGYEAFLEWGRDQQDLIQEPKMMRKAWELATQNADTYYQPGVFTTFHGFEWTPHPNGNNMHRVVVFRDGKQRTAQVQPMSTYDSADAEDLWRYLGGYEDKTGGQVLAIPHNGNLSNGWMFDDKTYTGQPLSRAYAETRSRWEPIVEVTQMKGDGEAHPLLSPGDEFADFETVDKGNLMGLDPKTPDMLPKEYAREALKRGLAYNEKLGANPFKFGMIGSTDAHTSLPTTREENWFGKAPYLEPKGDRVEHALIKAPDPELSLMAYDLGAAGLAAVWARENTRESIWDAMARKEVFATSGTRLIVRVFAGWDFEEDEVQRPDFARQGYARGVPMGGDLSSAPQGQAPSFLIRALRDPDGANLDRIQIIKGWVDAKGETHEKVYDVAWSDNRQPGRDGKLPPVGNTVNVADASYTNSIGDALLMGFWKDPDFDPTLRAFYYVRVLEIPTPRWTAYDAKFFNAKMPDGTRMQHQERAYTSPIWYTP
ncbi:MAG: DUF3604 domain-containing protein, partial [Thermoanaerobaculia bacterium]